MRSRMGKAIAKKGHSLLGAGAAVIASIPAAIAALVAIGIPSISSI